MKAGVAGLVFLLLGQVVSGQQVIRLRNRTGVPPADRSRTLQELPRAAHYILQFRTVPGPETRKKLIARGLRVLGPVPLGGLLVATGGGADLTGLDVIWAGTLAATDKISPLLADSGVSTYLVMFHPDVEADRTRALAAGPGLTIIDNPDLLPGQLLVGGSLPALHQLADADEVAYIMPASADLVAGNPVMGCAGATTEDGVIGQYVAVGAGWPRDAGGQVSLNYFFQSFTEKMAESTVRSEVERAFAEWQRYANVTLSPGDRADAVRTITIQFARRDHGDGHPFDGRGGVLAHTYYPASLNSEPIAGDMHMDADEDWHAGANTDLFTVALHETGHALGLGHSDRPGAVMYPYYRFAAGLTDDDIAGIRTLYGSRDTTAPAEPPVEPPSTPPTQPPPTPPTEPPPTPPPTPPTEPPSAPGGDTTAPSLKILSPASTIVSTSATSIRMSGTAADTVGVVAVKFTTSTGRSGTAAGTANWSVDVPLLVGTNTVTVRAYDAAGNSSWRAVTVVRR